MATNTKKKSGKMGNSRLTTELLETAREMHDSGLMTNAAHEEIVLRHFEEVVLPVRPLAES